VPVCNPAQLAGLDDRFGEDVLRRRELPRAEIDSRNSFSPHLHQAASSRRAVIQTIVRRRIAANYGFEPILWKNNVLLAQKGAVWTRGERLSD
jgi:hypothetical protein